MKAMTKRADPLEQQLCFALYSANNAMGRLYRPMLHDLGLTYPQYLVLLALWEKDAQTVGDLGKVLFLESNTLTPLLKRMETANLLRRERSLEDERSVTVSLTDAGRALEEKAHDIGICISNVASQSGVDIGALRDQITALADRLRAGV
jgi:DNA-binding MarR family transcriptional regulator